MSTLFVRMPTDLYAAIVQAASRDDRTVSQFVRHTMREVLEERLVRASENTKGE